MTIYDDDKHPRGQADNPGQFRDKANSGPEAALGTTPGQAVDARRVRLETAHEALGIYESGVLSRNDSDTGEHWTTVDKLAESLRDMLAEDAKANSGPDGSLAAADATYEEALAAGRRNGASHATDAQLMAMFCDTSLQTLCGAVSPQLVWDGARKKGLSTGALGDLAASAPMEVAELMWA